MHHEPRRLTILAAPGRPHQDAAEEAKDAPRQCGKAPKPSVIWTILARPAGAPAALTYSSANAFAVLMFRRPNYGIQIQGGCIMTNPAYSLAVPTVAFQYAREATQDMDRRAERSTSKVIRDKCLECNNGSRREIQLCQVFGCALWLCRFGKRPATVRKTTPQWLDPEFVAAEAYRQCLREGGGAEAPGMPQNPTDRTLIASCAADDEQTVQQSPNKRRSRKPR
jgi:hypothetical protein